MKNEIILHNINIEIPDSYKKQWTTSLKILLNFLKIKDSILCQFTNTGFEYISPNKTIPEKIIKVIDYFSKIIQQKPEQIEINTTDADYQEIFTNFKTNIDSLLGFPVFYTEGSIFGALFIFNDKIINLSKIEKDLINSTVTSIESNLYVILSEFEKNFSLLQKEPMFNDKFHTIFLKNPFGIGIVNINFKFIDVNYSLCEILGYNKNELLNKTFIDITYPEDMEKEYSLAKNIVENDISYYEIEKRYIHKNGNIIWTRGILTYLKDNTGNYTFGFIIVEDITERKRTIKALNEIEKKYILAIEASNDGIWEYNLENNKMYMNPACYKILEYDPYEFEISNDNWREITQSNKNFLELWNDYFEGKVEKFENELKIKTKSGSFKWIFIKGKIVENDENNNPVKLTGILSDINEKKLLNEKIKNNQLKYRTLFDNANDAIFLLHDKIFIDCNKKALDMFNCEKNDIINKTPMDFSPEKQPDGSDSREAALLKISYAMDEPQHFEWVHCKKNGKTFFAEVTLNKLELKNETHLQAIVKDISERKIFEMKLKESEKLYRNLFEGSLDGIVFTDTDYNFFDCNNSFLRMLGYSLEELHEKKNIINITPEKYHSWEKNEIIEKQLEVRGFTDTYEKEYIREDGTVFPIESTAYKLNRGDGLPDLYWAVVRDITARKLSEEILKQSEEKFRKIFDEGPLGMALLKIDKTIMAANQRICEITGYSENEIIGKLYTVLSHPEFKDKDSILIDNLMNNKIPHYQTERRMINKNGNLIWINITASIIHDNDNNPIYGLVMLEDITERKNLENDKLIKEKMLIRAERLASLGTLASAIAHEIRQPLQLIKVIADTILIRYKKQNNLNELALKNKTNIQEISGGVNRINDIIDNMQKLVRTSGDIKTKKININDIINDILKLYKQKIKDHCIILILELDDNIKKIEISEVQFQQVIVNILNNAIEALDTINKEKKEITLVTRQISKNVILEIIDNGPGIKDNLKEKIFDPMFSTKFDNNSMGMGLYIVHNIIQTMNGSIEVFNNEIGGATFRIKL